MKQLSAALAALLLSSALLSSQVFLGPTPVVAAANVPLAPDETAAAASGNLKLWLKADAITGIPASMQSGLQAYWNLDEASGTRDDAFGANDLADNATVTQATGKVVSAAQFTAANSEYLSIADNAALSTGDIDFTVAGWIYLDTKVSSQYLISHYDAGGAQRAWALAWEASYSTAADRFALYVSSDGTYTEGTTGKFVAASSLGSPSTGTWYFIAAWHDASANTINIQVNNGAVDSVAWSAGVFDSNAAFTIGARSDPAGYVDGRIDSVGFWKRVLTSAERTALYNGGNGVQFGALPDGHAVGTWSDAISGCDFVQATGSKQPLYRATGGSNSRPAVEFDGNDDNLVATTGSCLDAMSGISRATVFFVHLDDRPANTSTLNNRVISFTQSNTANLRAWFGTLNSTTTPTADKTYTTTYSRHVGLGTAATVVSTEDDVPVSTWALGTIRARFDEYPEIGNTQWFRAGGSARPVGFRSSADFSGSLPVETSGGVSVGSNFTGTSTNAVDGKVTDIIVFNAALSDADVKGVEIYLACKYGLSLSYTFVCPVLDLDASNIVGVADGSAVATWPDAGLGRCDMTNATGGEQPLYRATGGNASKPTVEFDGSNDRLLSTCLGIVRNASGLSLLSVQRITASGTLIQASNTAATVVTFRAFIGQGTNPYRLHMAVDKGSGAQNISTTLLPLIQNTWQLAERLLDFTALDHGFYVNGAFQSGYALNTITTGNLPDTDVEKVGIGASPSTGASAINARVSYITLYTTKLSTANRRAREAAICRKYGLTCQ